MDKESIRGEKKYSVRVNNAHRNNRGWTSSPTILLTCRQLDVQMKQNAHASIRQHH